MSDLEQTRTDKNETTHDAEHQETIPHVETQDSTITAQSEGPIPDTESPKAKTPSEASNLMVTGTTSRDRIEW